MSQQEEELQLSFIGHGHRQALSQRYVCICLILTEAFERGTTGLSSFPSHAAMWSSLDLNSGLLPRLCWAA